VIGLATRMVTGWQLARHMRTNWSPTPWRWPSATATSSQGRCLRHVKVGRP